MTLGNLTKEFHKLLKNISTLSDGQAEIVEWSDEDVSTFKVDVKPHSGPYKGGTFRFTVTLGETFPETAPVIRCETQIYHPNIDPTEECDDTNICLNMFNSDEWQEAYGMDGLVQGLLFLFYEPNLEDPLSPYFDSTSEVDFEMNVLASLKGEIVEGVQYDWNFGEKETVEEKEDDQDPSVSKVDNSKSNMVDKAEDNEKGDNSSLDDAVILREKRQAVDLDIIAQRRHGVVVCDNLGMIRDPQCNNVSSGNGDDTAENLFSQPCDLSKTVVKTEELSTLTSDLNLQSNALSHCPEVTVDLGLSSPHQPHVDSRDVDLSVQCETASASMSEMNLLHKSVSLSSYDPVVPEMNLLFLMVNKVTKLFKTCHRTCKK